MAFYQRHVCRLAEWPDCVMRTLAIIAASPVYGYMNGPSEFTITGTLKGWERRDMLGEISVPTLIVASRHDEMGSCWETLQRGIAGSKVAMFENSSHMPHVEEPEAFFPAVRDFLRRAESA